MEMPGYLDYQKMAMQDPMAYGQSMDQLGLAKLFQAEKQKQAESKTLADMMANDQSREMNPLLVQQQRLNNIGKDTTNQDAGLTLERNKAMQTANLNADQRAAAMKITDDQLKSAQQKIELDYMSGDPERIKRAQQGEQFLSAVRAEKRKAADEMEKVKEQGRNSLAVTNANVAGQRGIEQMRIDAGKYDKKAGISWAVKFGSLPPATRVGNLQAALTAGKDPATGEPMDAETRAMYVSMLEQDMATLNAANNARGGNTGVTLSIPQGGGSPALVNKTPVTVNPQGNSQPQPKIQSPQDQQALNWANANPNDPRAAAIKKKLGVN